ncbi:hypothetical protein [Echinicola sp. 20G]|nr:hypothetical protein [Echinicola sp. 20G]
MISLLYLLDVDLLALFGAEGDGIYFIQKWATCKNQRLTVC